MQQTPESLAAVEGIGKTIAESVHGFFSDPGNRELIDRILENGVEIFSVTPPVAGKTLEGKSFVLTGTLPNLTRSQAKALDRGIRRKSRQRCQPQHQLSGGRGSPGFQAGSGPENRCPDH